MYIDTHSEESMKNDICKYLGVLEEELYKFLLYVLRVSRNDQEFNSIKFDNVINNFIKEHLPQKQIDEVLLFHFSRRLNSANDIYYSNNLHDLLLTENEFSKFLKEHEVSFSLNEDHLVLYYKGKLVALDNPYDSGTLYIKSRLGYNKGYEDFCFNGLAFKDLIHLNVYASILRNAPEFLGNLANVLECKDIQKNYYLNSTYYCFEYLIPIEKVIFDNNKKLGCF